MRRLAVLAGVVLIVAVLGVAQLVLPGIAAQRLHDRLSASGTVLSVDVHAFPAIELLWHHADRVVVRMQRYRSSSGQIGGLLGQAGGVHSLDASVGELDSGLLTVRAATLHKRGDALAGSARVTEADLRSAVRALALVLTVASRG